MGDFEKNYFYSGFIFGECEYIENFFFYEQKIAL
jgi:hypothetical protein